MMKQVKYILILLGISVVTAADSQVVVQINAGSRAIWGTNQNLFINQNGHCQFYLNEVRGPVKDSSDFNIPVSQLDSFLAKAEQVGFFKLNQKYDGGFADGAGIFISLNSAGKKHSVDLLNKDLPPIHELIAYLNIVLAPHRIRINYGQ